MHALISLTEKVATERMYFKFNGATQQSNMVTTQPRRKYFLQPLKNPLGRMNSQYDDVLGQGAIDLIRDFWE